ncbi:hypothetical protein EOE18_13365 [Novosphingobium umbonatum]|uniref:Lipoprotein n=1 Tax=Novosphingobium umbonatum TaxID=1908524 RepID=A0A437N1R3_9SPHN|nr:hypothetical protein [Novosphingobium umbonatum]RVU03849.1 hypothetical protein EOE18_13365 [Novosphingobium umbonatum]
MKANPQSSLLLLTLTLAACTVPPAAPPAPAPVVAAPRPAPPPVAQPLDWQSAPVAEGHWQLDTGHRPAQARFAAPSQQLTAQCSSDHRFVQITLHASHSAPLTPTLAITTSRGQRVLDASLLEGSRLLVNLPVGEKLLDAIAFSRGRWMVEVPGLAPLILPATPEFGRVVDDCRQSGGK